MPQGLRTDRVGDLIRMELSTMLARDVRDPGVRRVTVTRVKMTKDLQRARVYYMAPADASSAKDADQALRRARSFLKRQLGQRLRLRHVPELIFLYDDSVEQQDNVARLLDQVADERSSASDDHEPHEA